jgi:hypothetical protein
MEVVQIGGITLTDKKANEIKMIINGEETVFSRILCTGKAVENKEQNTTIMYGYETFEEFINDFINVVLTTYQFLEKESTNTKEEVIKAMEDIIEDVMEAIKSGEYSSKVSEV